MNVTLLDMDKCKEGPPNSYTALALAIWNAAIEAAAKSADHVRAEGGITRGDMIRGLKK
jgi:hypothetical protein